MQRLHVYFGERACGELEESSNLKLTFSYSEEWVEHGSVPVSTMMPIAAGVFEDALVTPFVANLLPEGKSLRHRFERLLHVDPDHDFGLLSRLGHEVAGALSFWLQDEYPPTGRARYDALDPNEFDSWREFAHRQPLLVRGGVVRMSLAGAQAKVALYFDENDQAHVPLDGAPTTHILKPRIMGCSPSTVFTELLSMRLARVVLGAGEVPETDVWRNCYRIQRFDRPIVQGRVTRRHQEDFCTALGRMPQLKYEGGSPRERLLAPCFELIDLLGDRGYIKVPALARQRLLNQVIVNVLMHNPDAHLKNYGLLFDDDGWISVAPLYDSLCTYGLHFAEDDAAWERNSGFHAHTRELSLSVGNALNIDEVDLGSWELFAIECGFTASMITRKVRSLSEAMRNALEPTIAHVVGEYPAAEKASEPFREGIRGQLSRV